jgi:hypothetical protein
MRAAAEQGAAEEQSAAEIPQYAAAQRPTMPEQLAPAQPTQLPQAQQPVLPRLAAAQLTPRPHIPAHPARLLRIAPVVAAPAAAEDRAEVVVVGMRAAADMRVVGDIDNAFTTVLSAQKRKQVGLRGLACFATRHQYE